MEYLQYLLQHQKKLLMHRCFKPYYKWNTFNTADKTYLKIDFYRFKPYYKWNTFNTETWTKANKKGYDGFKPYYKWNTFNTYDVYA